MAPFHNLQPSFTGGEISPGIAKRVDLAKYGTALRTGRNVIVHPQGGVSNRPGTKLVMATKFPTRKARLIRFVFSNSQAYMLEFGHLYIRIHLNGGTLLSSGVPYEVVTPYTETDLPGIKFTQSADTLYLNHPSYPPQTLSRISDGPASWTLAALTVNDGPFMLDNGNTSKLITPSGISGTITLTTTFDLFQAGHVGALFRIRQAIPAQVTSGSLAGSSTSVGVLCGGTWRLTTHGNWGAALLVQRSSDGASWDAVRQFTSDYAAGAGDFNVDTFGTESDAPFQVRISMGSYTGGACSYSLSTDPFQATGIVRITAVAGLRSATATVLQQLGSTLPAWEWAEGAWSAVRGYPSPVVFFEDRLAMAATPAQPTTTWFSQSGVYSSFGTSNPLVDSDSIGVNLPSRQMNGINNLVGLQRLLELTAATEWSIGPPDGTGVMTPTAIQQRVEGTRGSSSVDPVIVGNRCLYIQPMGSVVRDLTYDFQYNGYTGDDLTRYARHLFSGFSIVEMAYQQEPDSLVWCVRSDGKLLSMTYVKEEAIQGWTWHDTNVGTFESVSCIPGAGFDEVWLIANRNGNRFVERMVNRSAMTDVRQAYLVDCGISYDSPVAITAVATGTSTVVTAAAHGFANGDLVDLSDVAGLQATVIDPITGNETSPSQVNGFRFTIAAATTTTFELRDEDTGLAVDSSAWFAYVSGGNARKAVSSLSGLSHLSGLLVSILADGSVQPQSVVLSGTILLNPPASIVHVGIPFVSDVEPVKPELKLQDGTIQDRRIRVPKVTIAFENSAGGFVGSDADHLDELPGREDENMGAPGALRTWDAQVTIDSSFDRQAAVFFRQTDPLPFTINAITPQVDIGD